MEKNHNILSEFQHAIFQAEVQKNELDNKNNQIREKKSQLMQLQSTYLSKLTQKSRLINHNDLALFPKLNEIEKLIFSISETAIDSKDNSIQLSSIIKTNDLIHQILQSLVQSDDSTINKFAQDYSNFYSQRKDLLIQLIADNTN
ncbi:hypothetical protein TVAG_413620 [Trichomonas vaginalis G3]|uniref:Uncharacterized protein n=1 Tax=Trichomonas vaginalis (strain ATCC PRA-98 / G3) TaxID=412133 RepID=A2GRK4_TRIV3|nr:hypothetical protein TVAGG3_0251220 [Trichomonas vaginalis G3]EAX80212.1 hypothetical protein TVAG_413620 [Trichomonas vaginalis G3]KAI5554018.1 hypothetical protein TVAGG3_0251220 [Trichomonas vaginalis G3]|eukprot:XP_001293142.1 hypothetical protein [Trichomonas vaginalis G3]